MKAQVKGILPLAVGVLMLITSPGFAQQEEDQSEAPPSSGWHRFGETARPNPVPLPADLTLPAGTWITIRTDQPLSSDHNQPGDVFTATLAQPLVVNGLVIARRGQTVAGVVSSSEKAGRVKGTSSLGLELTELSLVDGRQIQVRTTLIERRGSTSVGRDAAAIGTSTGMGAAIGAAVDGGFGAGMGAIAGAAASTIGVLVTRGQPTIVSPEDQLAFRVAAPVTFALGPSADAFQPVRQEDYDQPRMVQGGPGPTRRPPAQAYYGGYYPPVYGGYYGPYYGGYYAPFYFGFNFYSRPYYYGRGYYRGGYYRGGYYYHR